MNSKEAFMNVLDTIENVLGAERRKHFHVHFSKIEYTKGGEKKHLTFSDTVFGPNPEPLMELLAEKGAEPTVICESDSTQAEDALYMKKCYLERRALP